jgi:hypothetical protein
VKPDGLFEFRISEYTHFVDRWADDGAIVRFLLTEWKKTTENLLIYMFANRVGFKYGTSVTTVHAYSP